MNTYLGTSLIFTSCGTESNSTAILSALEARPERREIITTVVEHPAVLSLCQHLEKKVYTVRWLKVNNKGRLDLDESLSLLSDKVAIASIMRANNETGTLLPVEEMAELANHANQAGVMFHTDAVQVTGKLPIVLQDTAIDMLSLAAQQDRHRRLQRLGLHLRLPGALPCDAR